MYWHLKVRWAVGSLVDRCYEAKGCLGEPGFFQNTKRYWKRMVCVCTEECGVQLWSNFKRGKRIHDGNPNPPIDTISSIEQSCPSWLSWSCCRHGSYFPGASLVLEPADCQADMHELAYRVMCMPWVKRTEHVGVWSEWFLMTFVQDPPKKRDKMIRI